MAWRTINPLRTVSGVAILTTSDDWIETQSSEVAREAVDPVKILSMASPTLSPPGNPPPPSDTRLELEMLPVRRLLRVEEKEEECGIL